MLPIIIDILLVAIIAISVWRGISKGLILSAVSLIAMIAVFFGARYIADNYSDRFSSVVSPLVSTTVSEATTQERVDNELEYDEADDDTLLTAAGNIYSRLGIYSNATDNMAQETVDSVNSSDMPFKEAVSAQFGKTLAYMFVFVIAYLLLNIIFAVVINLCNVFFKLPGLHILNVVGGGIAGLIVGLMVVFAICWAARYVGILSTSSIIDNTVVLKFFAGANPFNSLLRV